MTNTFQQYLSMLRQPFRKICRLRFLQPDGSTAFALGSQPENARSFAFLAEGEINCNLQNGQRRTATVTLENANADYDYALGKVWFGTEIALDEGLVLPDGTEYFIQQGVFLIDSPEESILPVGKTVTYNLVDKWAQLDGTLGGQLEGTYEVARGTNIFAPIAALLQEDRGNGVPVDRIPPIFTEYYNDMTQTLTDGTSALLTNAPYTLRIDSVGGTAADVILGLVGMVNAWVGYDASGALRLDPSQDDILDTTKPILWQFSTDDAILNGLAYNAKNQAVYNDYIIVGEALDRYVQPAGRAQNLDPASDTNILQIGRKTFRDSSSGYYTSTQCRDLAAWKLKRSSVLSKAVSITCSQILHLQENTLVSVVRTDKPGSPVERHLIQGFSRPLVGTEPMQISCVSTYDFPNITLTEWPLTN